MSTRNDIMRMTDEEKKTYLKDLKYECHLLVYRIEHEKLNKEEEDVMRAKSAASCFVYGMSACIEQPVACLIALCLYWLFRCFFILYIVMWAWGAIAYGDEKMSISELEDMNAITRHAYMYVHEKDYFD